MLGHRLPSTETAIAGEAAVSSSLISSPKVRSVDKILFVVALLYPVSSIDSYPQGSEEANTPICTDVS